VDESMNEFIIHMNETLKQDSLTDYTFGCSKDAISEVVVIAPNWKIDIFREHTDSIQEMSQKVSTKPFTAYGIFRYNYISYTHLTI